MLGSQGNRYMVYVLLRGETVRGADLDAVEKETVEKQIENIRYRTVVTAIPIESRT